MDDEPLARARLRRLLTRVGGDAIDIVAECVDIDELLATAARVELDLLFLDIEMPGGDGFSALARWRGPRPKIVFVTAYPQHGVRAFDVRAIDYLVKPVSAERLRDTLDRASAGASPAVEASETEIAKRLPLKIGQRTHLVQVDRIDLVLAQGNYLEVYADGATYTVRGTLSDFHARLDARAFVRLHRSAVVRIAAIREIEPAGSARFRVALRGGRHVYSGRQFRDRMEALLHGHAPGGLI
ncbi:LytR/AlgR family response regulator transcription factor [Lysobacter gummosus]|uniref:LytR/AlgR family response regulator transcription factor n=1 Tax=Lysobacter gummosus TaxID=262324 RepID=UPI00363F4723